MPFLLLDLEMAGLFAGDPKAFSSSKVAKCEQGELRTVLSRDCGPFFNEAKLPFRSVREIMHALFLRDAKAGDSPKNHRKPCFVHDIGDGVMTGPYDDAPTKAGQAQ